jgi:hypothetical protein
MWSLTPPTTAFVLLGIVAISRGGAREHVVGASGVRIGQSGEEGLTILFNGDFVAIFLSSGVPTTSGLFCVAIVCADLFTVVNPILNEAFFINARQCCPPSGASFIAIMFNARTVATFSCPSCVAVVSANLCTVVNPILNEAVFNDARQHCQPSGASCVAAFYPFCFCHCCL